MKFKYYVLVVLFLTVSLFITSRVINAQSVKENGVLNFEDGSIYIGDYIDDMADGKGVFVTKDGMVLKGIFKKGILTGHGLQINDLGIGYQIRGGIFKDNSFINGTQILHAPAAESTKDLGGAFVSLVLWKVGKIDNKFKMQIFNW